VKKKSKVRGRAMAAMQEKRQEQQQESAAEDDTFGPMPLAKLEVCALSISIF
jgi:hypothetical protein